VTGKGCITYPNEGWIPSEVVLAEDLGGELVVHLDAAGTRLITVVRHDRGLDLSGTSPVAEVMLIVTAQGARHAQALADFLLKNCAEENFETLGLEGYKNGQWVLLDCNDVLVHIFLQHNRDFYNLEGLWNQAKKIIDLPDEQPGASDDTDTLTTNAHEAANKDLA